MKHFEQLQSFYENEGEEELRLQEGSAHYLEYLTASRYLGRFLPPRCRVLDNCAGSGVYAFSLAEKGHRVTAGDIVPHNVDIMREKQQNHPPLEEIYCGDALDQSRFVDEAFDAVLCMGAFYHLDNAADRRRALDESLRVLRPGGLFACTYMNRYAVILNNTAGALDNLDEILTFAREGREGIFYASTPEEAASAMEAAGIEKCCHVALDGISNFLHLTAGLLNETGFCRWREYHAQVCETPSLLGYSYHNLFIGRKPEQLLA